jgi:hypothetical protein
MVGKKGQMNLESTESSNKRVIFLIVGILVILAVAIFFIVNFFMKKPIQKDIMGDCINYEPDIGCLAFVKNNVNICEEFNKTDNSSIEEVIQNCKDIYYMQKAIANSDISDCDKIVNEGVKKNCMFVKDGLCESFEYSLNDYVPSSDVNQIMCNALKSKDPVLCNSLNKLDKKYCLNLVLYVKALSEKNLDYSNQWNTINEELEGIKTKPILKAMIQGDASLCSPQKDLCEKANA